MTEPDNPPRRRPGAPRGNRNAVKTGLHTAEMKDLRRRLRAWRHRAKAAVAKANRQIRAEREARRDEARAASIAAEGEGGSPKTPKIEKQLSCVSPDAPPSPSPLGENGPKSNNNYVA